MRVSESLAHMSPGGILLRKGYSVVFEPARKYTIICNNIGLTSISQRLIGIYFRHINIKKN